jgi:hypothetical protein
VGSLLNYMYIKGCMGVELWCWLEGLELERKVNIEDMMIDDCLLFAPGYANRLLEKPASVCPLSPKSDHASDFT